MFNSVPSSRLAAPRAAVAAFLFLLSFLALGLSPAPAAMASAPGDTVSVVTLQANFDSDNPNSAPNLTLPSGPVGDHLSLETSAGTVLVIPSYDGLSRPVEIRQINAVGTVALNAFPAAIPAPPEKVTVRWRSVGKDDQAVILMAFSVRASNGATLASVEYLHQGQLSYNGLGAPGTVLPVAAANRRAQQFTIDVDFLTHTTSLAIDGTPVAGFQGVPFAQSGNDVASLACVGTGGSPQTMYADDLSMVARYRVPDHAPSVVAPSALTQPEQSAIAFTVTASDPDGDAIASLASGALPAGATFTPNGSNTSGAFAWTPDYTQAGSYAITFTASNALSGSATTGITVTNVDRAPAVTGPSSANGSEGSLLTFAVSASDPDGDAIASLLAGPLPAGATFAADPGNAGGTFAWTPGFAQAGSYSATVTATAGGLTGSLTTAIAISDLDRAPAVTAPLVVDGEEGGVLDFDVTASDPDGDAIGALTADLSSLPTGNGATFTAAAGNGSGSFHWPMKRGEAGSYDVAFTAANASSGIATTHINVAFAGTTVTGELIWTPQVGQEGTYSVTFTATNSLNETGSASTSIVVFTPASATAPTSDGRNVALSPERALKGPIVSVVGVSSAPTGKNTTISATATTTGSLSLAAALRGTNATASAIAADPGIVAFVADLSGLPNGNNAIFTVDKEPAVSSPASFTVNAGTALTFPVTATDPDADPILGLGADLSVLPAGNTATFTPNASFTSGTFAWTPRNEDSGTYTIVFTAFNALVGTSQTNITVNGVAPARVFSMGAKKIRLSSNKPFGCIDIEPINHSFSLVDIDLFSIRMTSVGTGSVSSIAAITSKQANIGDKDGNLIQDLEVCFTKSDLRALLSNLHGSASVTVTVSGSLQSGSLFQGTITLNVVAGGGSLATVLAPNPLNPTGTLSFLTKTAGRVRVSLFDLNGRLVRTLWRQENAAPGGHDVTVEARGADGRALSSGVYFYRIESPDGSDTGRFTVLK